MKKWELLTLNTCCIKASRPLEVLVLIKYEYLLLTETFIRFHRFYVLLYQFLNFIYEVSKYFWDLTSQATVASEVFIENIVIPMLLTSDLWHCRHLNRRLPRMPFWKGRNLRYDKIGFPSFRYCYLNEMFFHPLLLSMWNLLINILRCPHYEEVYQELHALANHMCKTAVYIGSTACLLRIMKILRKSCLFSEQ